MQAPTKLNFKMYQGSTFSEVIRWESSTKVYKTITNITQAAPCVITATAHGAPNGWRVKITNVGGMTDINSTENYRVVSNITSNTVELNDVNAVGFKAYTTGGIMEYNAPVVLTGYTARMQLRTSVDSTTTIDEYTSVNGKIQIDTAGYGITILVDAVTTAGYAFSSAVYSLELISPTAVVTQLATGSITLIREITK